MKVPIELQLVIYNFVALQFSTFSNDKNKGENFSWDNFPALMSNWVTSIMKLSAPFDSKYDDHAKEIAKKFAEQLVSKMHEPL